MRLKSVRALVLLAALAATAGVGAGPARAACPSTGATLLQTAAQATAGYQARDAAQVEASVASLRQDLLCAGTVLDPAQAAAVHRAMALQSFLAGNIDGTRTAFQAARAADPAYVLPVDLVPDGHPLRVAFDEAKSASAPRTEPLGQRTGQRTWIDGRQGQARPLDRPAIIQADQVSGQMVGSVYLYPDEPLPGWASATVATAPTVATPPATTSPTATSPTTSPTTSSTSLASATPPEETVKRREQKQRDPDARRGPSKGLLFTGIGLGAASAGLWAASVIDGLEYEDHTARALDGDYRNQDDVEEAQDKIDAHYNRVNALGYAAQASSATAGVLLVAAFVF